RFPRRLPTPDRTTQPQMTKYDKLTDDELDRLFAERVAGPAEHRWQETHDGRVCAHCGLESWEEDRPCAIRYSHDAQALIPHLEQCGWHIESCFYDDDDQDWVVKLSAHPSAVAPTFNRAVMIALFDARDP